MNDLERADTIRGFKVVLIVFGGLFILAGLWQSTDESFHSVLIFLGVVVTGCAFWYWRHRTGRPRPAGNNSSTLPTNKSASLIERHQGTIATYRNQIHLSGSYEVENTARDCIGAIAHEEGRTNLEPHGEYLYKWEQRSDIPDEYRRLAEHLKTEFEKRVQELHKLKDEQIGLKAEKLLSANWDLVEKFLEITERKVSVLDDYGDEHWDALPEEIVKCMKKISERERPATDLRFVKRTKTENWKDTIRTISWTLSNEYRMMPEKLQQLFQEHHEEAKSKHRDETDLHSLSGVEFETHIARVLRSAGYEVQGTPTTGDQGADLIAKKNGRTIIIQAKRYQGVVGNKAVQEIVSAVSFYGGDEGWVITNSTFSASAIALAQKTSVKLIDGPALRSKAIL
jgi:hypothetical protein